MWEMLSGRYLWKTYLSKRIYENKACVSKMELIAAGEEFHAAMKRSTNGGGENSPMIEAEDDFYELFFANLEED